MALDKWDEQHADTVIEMLSEKLGIDLSLEMVEYIVCKFVQVARKSEVTKLEEVTLKATTGYKQLIEEGKKDV